MTFKHDQFTMSYHQARDFRIDYRDYQKVDHLPTGVTLKAIAGVWGDYANIRCLFECANGKRYLRDIRRWGDAGYFVGELNLDAKAINVGQTFKL